MASVSVFIFIVLVIKLIVDDCLPAGGASLHSASHHNAYSQMTRIRIYIYVCRSECMYMYGKHNEIE